MAANLTWASVQVLANGKTIRATPTGGTGTGYAVTGLTTGVTINAGGLRHTIPATMAINAGFIEFDLGFPLDSTWTGCTFSTTTSTPLTDSGGNTSQAQSNVAFTNNSTKTVTAYPAGTTVGLYGIFGTTLANGGRNLSPQGAGGTGSTGIAFSATGADIAFIGFANIAGGYSVSVNGAAATTSALLPASAVAANACLPLLAGGTDAAHEIKLNILNGYYDLGTAATAGQVLGTILVANAAAPALNAPDGGAWGLRYFLDSSPFTDVVSGALTKGRIDRAVTATNTITTKVGYLLDPGGRVAFWSSSSSVAVWTFQNGQKLALYQDGVLVATITVGTGNTVRRNLLAFGLDTTTNHFYEVFKVDFSTTTNCYIFYVELNGNGIANVAQAVPYKIYEYGDSRTEQSLGIVSLDVRDGHTFWLGRQLNAVYLWCTTGSGQRVTTWGTLNVSVIPTDVDEVVVPLGINDISAGSTGATLQSDYQTMLGAIRTRIGAGKRITAVQPLSYATANSARNTAGTTIAAAVTAMADAAMRYIPTGVSGVSTGWMPENSAFFKPSDIVHFNGTLGYPSYRNHQLPAQVTSARSQTSFTLTAPATHVAGSASGNGTVTIFAGATFTGDWTITLTSDNASDVITPSVGSPGTGAVTVTPASGATSFTYTVNRSTAGTSTITPTVGALQVGWTLPAAASYVATSSDTTPPVVASANVNAAGTTLTIAFTEAGSPPVLPSSSVTGFTLTASGGVVTLSSTAISSTTFTATTSRTIGSTETLTLAYTPGNVTDSATSPNSLASFSGTSVTNNSTQDLIAPTLTAASINAAGTTLTLTFSETVTGVAAADFTLSGGAALSAVSGSGTSRTMTITPSVLQGQTRTLAYSGTATKDAANNLLATFSGAAVTNNSTDVAPTVTGASINSSGTTLTITFSESVTGAVAADYGLSGGATLSSISGSGTSRTMTISPPVLLGQTRTISYTGTGTKDVNNNLLATFSGGAVTNNSTNVAPTVTSAVVDAAGTTLTLTFSESVTGVSASDYGLTGGTLSAVSGSGSTRTMTIAPAVYIGATPTLSYTGAATTDLSGVALTAFSGASVTNNSAVPVPTPPATAASGATAFGFGFQF